VMIDTDRMTNGADLATELRKGKRGGIPWSVILDGDGQPKINSDGPEGNIGCPAKPHEIDHFLKMIDTRQGHMSKIDRAVIERELRKYGAALSNRSLGQRLGAKAFAKATKSVRFGHFEDAISQLTEACEDGYAPESILTNPAMRPLREDPDRRLQLFELFKRNVKTSKIQIIDAREPGRRIHLAGRLVDMHTGQAIPNALMQVFHTDASGEYRPGMDAGGGAGNPRLWGFLRSDAQGHFTVHTVMPERYTNSSVPRHIHYKVWADGYQNLVSECFFDSDPNLDESTRKSAPDRNFPIVKLKQTADHRSGAELVVRVPGSERPKKR
jgi:protocatechuate 3,4-dioxygenase beta subunit